MTQEEIHIQEPSGGGSGAVANPENENKKNYGKYFAFGIIIAMMIAGIIYAVIR